MKTAHSVKTAHSLKTPHSLLIALVFGLTALIAADRAAYAQASSTGGTLGKTDKSASGGEDKSEPPSKEPHRGVTPRSHRSNSDPDVVERRSAAPRTATQGGQISCGQYGCTTLPKGCAVVGTYLNTGSGLIGFADRIQCK